MMLAKKKLADAEQHLAWARASGRPPGKQIDPMGNLTDPDSRKMRCSGGGYLQGYNAQLAVTDDHLILATSISQSPSDQTSGIPMINAAVAAVEKLTAATGLPGQEIGMLVLDAGYCSIDTITAPGPDRLIATWQSKATSPEPGQPPDTTRRTQEPSPGDQEDDRATRRTRQRGALQAARRDRGTSQRPPQGRPRATTLLPPRPGRGRKRTQHRRLGHQPDQAHHHLNPEPGT